jgi:hypothetical protein
MPHRGAPEPFKPWGRAAVLIRDFKAQIGFTPAAYARQCAAAAAP